MSHRFIAHDENGDLKVHTPFHADFIADLKNLVDKDSRRWVPGGPTKRGYWWIDCAYESQVEDLIRDYFGAKAGKATAKHATRTSRVHEEEVVIQNVGEEDVVLALVSSRDPEQTIRDLTSRLGALTYELDMERAEARRLRDENMRVHNQAHRLDRENNELKYKLQLAEGGIGEMPHRGRKPMAGGPYAVLHLADDAPPEVVQAAYKALALKHHPDRGGDVREMQKLNDAMDKLGRSKA